MTSDDAGPAVFDAGQPYEMHPQVAIRPESFGALAYHYGNRRLVFLKSRRLVELVASLGDYETAAGALEALVPTEERAAYGRALARLATSEVIDAR